MKYCSLHWVHWDERWAYNSVTILIFFGFNYFFSGQLFSCFYTNLTKDQKQKEWQRLVVVMNDKIRGMRRGKYKNNEDRQL